MRGPLKSDQLRDLLADIDLLELPDVLQRAARMGMELATPGLLTQADIDELVDLDTLSESGDHVDLHGSYQRAASKGAGLVLAAGIRKVPTFIGVGDAYVCVICDSGRYTSPDDIVHRGPCAEIRARMRGTA